MEAPNLGSRWRQLLHRALRARRNRSLVSHFGCETHEERCKTDGGVAFRWTPTQRLRGIPRRIANRKVGRSSGLSALSLIRRARRPCSRIFSESRPTKDFLFVRYALNSKSTSHA